MHPKSTEFPTVGARAAILPGAYQLSQPSRSLGSWINWESWNLWGQKTLQSNRERVGFVSSSLPAPMQEFRNLIQGILGGGLRGKEFTPTHPGFSLTPHFFLFFVTWASSLEKCLQIFCPEIHPTLTLRSCVPLPPVTEAPTALTPEHPCTAPQVGTENLPLAGISSWIYKYHGQSDPLQRAFLLRKHKKLPGIQFNKFSPHHVIYWNEVPRVGVGFSYTGNWE